MALSRNLPHKYKDFIFESTKISSGPPAVYQLNPKKEKIETLSRVTIGKKIPGKKNKAILLVGETGAGKSTLINALFNYSMGVKWEDGVWFQIVEEEKRSQTESQTSDVIVYEIFGFEGKALPYTLTIIDTPGFGDTRGTDKDDIVMKRLFDLFRSEDGVNEIHAVGLVMTAAVNRLSDRLMYIFDSLMSLFGRDVQQNIIALITHSDGVTPDDALKALQAANIEFPRNADKLPVHFCFNNQQNKKREKINERSLKAAWSVTEQGIHQFKAFLGSSKPQNMTKTVEVMNSRIRLTACIQNLKDKIEITEMKQAKIKKIQKALKENEEKMKKNEKFTIEVDDVIKDKEPIVEGWMWKWLGGNEGAVCCIRCEETCHYPGCTWANNPEYCEVMENGRCTVCTNKCLPLHHVKAKWRYVNKSHRVLKTLEEMKEKYEKNKRESENKLSLLEQLEMEMNQLTAEKFQFLDESFQHFVKLEQIALKVDSASTIVHLDLLIEKMKEKEDKEKTQKLEEMRSRVDEGTKSGLRYKFGQMSRSCMKYKNATLSRQYSSVLIYMLL